MEHPRRDTRDRDEDHGEEQNDAEVPYMSSRADIHGGLPIDRAPACTMPVFREIRITADLDRPSLTQVRACAARAGAGAVPPSPCAASTRVASNLTETRIAASRSYRRRLRYGPIQP